MPIWLLIPGALLVWTLAQKFAEGRHEKAQRESGLGRSGPEHRKMFSPSRRSTFVPVALTRKPTAADYLCHLNEAGACARTLDSVKPLALRGDVSALMHAPPEVALALAAMTAPLPTIFVQRDLNVLGAEPSLPENDLLGPETLSAIGHFQSRFKLPATGAVDAQTAVALRYAVGCIYSQDKVVHGG